ncbi:TadE/TadG family type IV pilus assembly protein [Neomesorhizobium albiziae]|nr:TadE/TadG family type IV pilus assembly protein [Mesorhizobium albiziae]
MGVEQASGPDCARAKRWRPRIVLRFCGDQSGSTVVEFGMLLLPFLLLLFAILETCISFAAGQVMANAVDDVSRQIRTGQIKADGLNATNLRNLICGKLEMMVASGCPGLAIDLRTEDTFSKLAAIPMPITGTGDQRTINPGMTQVQKPKSLEKSMLRVLYPWPIMTNMMQKSLSTLADGKILLLATATWQNEPFDD